MNTIYSFMYLNNIFTAKMCHGRFDIENSYFKHFMNPFSYSELEKTTLKTLYPNL